MPRAAPAPALIDSERFALARAVLVAALQVPGVAAANAGPSGVIVSTQGTERLEGVICAASPDGYDVVLGLTCTLVPLHPLADSVRTAAQKAATGRGIRLGRVTVEVVDIVDPREQ